MDIIGCTYTGKLGKKRSSKKFMAERLMKRDGNKSINEEEMIIIRKTWEINVCDRKINSP